MDPYQVAKDNNVLVIAEPLGAVLGYYGKVADQKIIHVHEELPEYFHRYVVAHMLYGAIERPEEMLLLKEKKALQFTEAEKAANTYAMELLLAGEDLGSVEDLMAKHGMSEEDQKDLSLRLTRVFGYQGGLSLPEQVRHVIATYRNGGRSE